MDRKIGRFSAYIPNRDLFQTLLSIFSLTGSRPGVTINSPLSKLHAFFYKMKQKYPDFFEDVYFNDDPDFPYSREIADTFIQLQETEYLTRPNPSLNKYRIAADLSKEKPINGSIDFQVIQDIAEKFRSEFRVENEQSCNS